MLTVVALIGKYRVFQQSCSNRYTESPSSSSGGKTYYNHSACSVKEDNKYFDSSIDGRRYSKRFW